MTDKQEGRSAAETRAEKNTTLECAIGGAYKMPDGRTFWIDGPVAREIERRVRAALPKGIATSPAPHAPTNPDKQEEPMATGAAAETRSKEAESGEDILSVFSPLPADEAARFAAVMDDSPPSSVPSMQSGTLDLEKIARDAHVLDLLTLDIDRGWHSRDAALVVKVCRSIPALIAEVRNKDAALTAANEKAARMQELLRQFITAVDAGACQIASQEIDGEAPQGFDDPGRPAHPWHEEWLHYVRAALTASQGD